MKLSYYCHGTGKDVGELKFYKYDTKRVEKAYKENKLPQAPSKITLVPWVDNIYLAYAKSSPDYYIDWTMYKLKYRLEHRINNLRRKIWKLYLTKIK